VLFSMLAVLVSVYSAICGGWFLLLLWPALSLGLVSAAYFGVGPCVFGKRFDGTMRLASVAVLLPYLSYAWFVWYLLRLVRRESPVDELLPNVMIGRRLISSELTEDVERVVDLTCEFVEPRRIRAVREYISFPILDGVDADPQQLVCLARRLAVGRSMTLIHCAQGHGRTGMVASALLLVAGYAASADEAIRFVQAKRKLVRLKPTQSQAVCQVARILCGGSSAPT